MEIQFGEIGEGLTRSRGPVAGSAFRHMEFCFPNFVVPVVFLHPGNIQPFPSKSLEDDVSFSMRGVGYVGFIRLFLPLFSYSKPQSEVVKIKTSSS